MQTIFLLAFVMVAFVATLQAHEDGSVPTEASIATMGEAPAFFFYWGCGECDTEEINCGPPGGNCGEVHSVACDFNGFGWECEGSHWWQDGSCSDTYGTCNSDPEPEPEVVASIFFDALDDGDLSRMQEAVDECTTLTINESRSLIQIVGCDGSVAMQMTVPQVIPADIDQQLEE